MSCAVQIVHIPVPVASMPAVCRSAPRAVSVMRATSGVEDSASLWKAVAACMTDSTIM